MGQFRIASKKRPILPVFAAALWTRFARPSAGRPIAVRTGTALSGRPGRAEPIFRAARGGARGHAAGKRLQGGKILLLPRLLDAEPVLAAWIGADKLDFDFHS